MSAERSPWPSLSARSTSSTAAFSRSGYAYTPSIVRVDHTSAGGSYWSGQWSTSGLGARSFGAAVGIRRSSGNGRTGGLGLRVWRLGSHCGAERLAADDEALHLSRPF